MTNELPFILGKDVAIDLYKMESVEELRHVATLKYIWIPQHAFQIEAKVLIFLAYIPKVSEDSQSVIAMFCLET